MFSSPRTRRDRHDYTLMDAVVILSVLTTLILLLAPTISASIRESRTTVAHADCYKIAVALIRFVDQTGGLPSDPETSAAPAASAPPVVLTGPGRAPAEVSLTEWSRGRTERLRPDLMGDAAQAPRAATPGEYPWHATSTSEPLPTDPWGRRYVANVAALGVGSDRAQTHTIQAVWVLSAGPNGIIETPFGQPVKGAGLAGDDIGVRIQ